jgi:hypothetical protein
MTDNSLWDNYLMRYSYTDEPCCACNLSNLSALQVVYPMQCSGERRSPVEFSADNKHLPYISLK